MVFAVIVPASAYAASGTITVNLEGTPVDVSFDSQGVEILSVETIDDAFGASLILEVKVTGSPGILEIILERNFIDAKYQGDDDLFFVLVDGEDLNFEETETTSDSRTLRITLPEGTEEVEIIGTEFGATLILEVKVTGSPGILEIILERNFIDAKFLGEDDPFFVIVDGDDLNFEETETTSESRTLRITLPEGSEEIEIIGTEFGEPDMMEEEKEETMEEEKEETMEEEKEETMEEEKEETMEEEEERTQCGPGTVLKEGVCVLDQKCGPGTILQNGACVVSSTTSTGEVSISRDFIVGGGVALVISFILMLVLGAVARAGRKKSD